MEEVVTKFKSMHERLNNAAYHPVRSEDRYLTERLLEISETRRLQALKNSLRLSSSHPITSSHHHIITSSHHHIITSSHHRTHQI